jgi:hypothetical protein
LAKQAGEQPTYLCALIFPAEYTDEVAAWLNRIGYAGGDDVTGGPSVVSQYRQTASVLQRDQLWPMRVAAQQSVDEVLAHPMVQAG